MESPLRAKRRNILWIDLVQRTVTLPSVIAVVRRPVLSRRLHGHGGPVDVDCNADRFLLSGRFLARQPNWEEQEYRKRNSLAERHYSRRLLRPQFSKLTKRKDRAHRRK